METRTTYYDKLRITAAFAVMILHISSQRWNETDVNSYTWQIFNVYDGCVRWCVPIFVMISGALFLSSEHSLKKIFRKNILRIITAFLFWSILYGVTDGIENGSGIKSILVSIVRGPGHMWFLFMIAGVYLIIPFLKKITESEQLTKYFLLLALIFAFVIPQGISVMGIFSTKLSALAKEIVGKISFHFALGYAGYFLLGYYLSKAVIGKQVKRLIYLAGVCGFILTVGGTALLSVSRQEASEMFYGYLTVNVLLESIALFVWFREHDTQGKISGVKGDMLSKMARYSFGAYLVHVMVMGLLSNHFGLNALAFNAAIAIPVTGIVVFVISFAISALLSCIPVLNKYIV